MAPLDCVDVVVDVWGTERRISVSQETTFEGLFARQIGAVAKGQPYSLLMLTGENSSLVEEGEVERVLKKAVSQGNEELLEKRFKQTATREGEQLVLRFSAAKERRASAAQGAGARGRAVSSEQQESGQLEAIFKGGEKKTAKQVRLPHNVALMQSLSVRQHRVLLTQSIVVLQVLPHAHMHANGALMVCPVAAAACAGNNSPHQAHPCGWRALHGQPLLAPGAENPQGWTAERAWGAGVPAQRAHGAPHRLHGKACRRGKEGCARPPPRVRPGTPQLCRASHHEDERLHNMHEVVRCGTAKSCIMLT